MSSINCVLRTFLLVFFIGLLLACVLVGHAAPPPAPDAEAILKRADTFRNGWPSYVLKVKITNYESDKADEEKFYEVSQKGTEKTYVEFLSPREKGEHLLMLGDDMWVYLPDTSRPVRITPLERLSGDASNGDVARTNYAADYTPVYLRTEKVDAEECYVLDLTAKRKGATYQRILFWVRVQDARPVRAEFYLTSGKHIKSATFDDYMTVEGRNQLRRMTLYDEIRHNSHSVLEYSGIAPRELPDSSSTRGAQTGFSKDSDTRLCFQSIEQGQAKIMKLRLLIPIILIAASLQLAAQDDPTPDAPPAPESRYDFRYSISLIDDATIYNDLIPPLPAGVPISLVNPPYTLMQNQLLLEPSFTLRYKTRWHIASSVVGLAESFHGLSTADFNLPPGSNTASSGLDAELVPYTGT